MDIAIIMISILSELYVCLRILYLEISVTTPVFVSEVAFHRDLVALAV